MVQWSEVLDCLQSLSLNSLFCYMFVSWIHVIQARHQCLPSLNYSEKKDLKRVLKSGRFCDSPIATKQTIDQSIHRYMSVRTRVSKLGIRANEWQKPTNDIQFVRDSQGEGMTPRQVDGQLSRCAAFWIAGSTEMKTNSSQWQKLLGWQRHWHLTKPFCKSWLAEGPCGEKDWFSMLDSRFFASRLWHVNSFLEAVIAYQTFT